MLTARRINNKVQKVSEGVILNSRTRSVSNSTIFTDVQKFTLFEAAAQAFVFFVGGFETSSTTMQFALYELALNKDVQERLREEIKSVLDKHDGKITYDGINEMDYLDRVVSGKKFCQPGQ
jgi:cytochrome P450